LPSGIDPERETLSGGAQQMSRSAAALMTRPAAVDARRPSAGIMPKRSCREIPGVNGSATKELTVLIGRASASAGPSASKSPTRAYSADRPPLMKGLTGSRDQSQSYVRKADRGLVSVSIAQLQPYH